MPKSKWTYCVYVISSLLLSMSVLAQTNCPAIVQEAFELVERSCEGLERNSACYGSNNVQASFYQDVSDEFFTLPGDLAILADVASITTVPLDTENNLWGIAVLQVQANLPNTLPGQNVIFVLLGDAELVDDVSEDVTIPSIEPIDVQLTANSNVRSGPGLQYNVITTLDNNSALQADGISEDGAWVRVLFDNRPGWVFVDLIAGETDSLPVIEGILGARMQAFHMRTGIGAPDCIEAPDAVLIQGTEDFEIEFMVNGAEVRIGSTALLQQIAPDMMQISMLDGTGWVDDLRIPAGWKAQIQLDPEGGMSESNGQEDLPEADGQWMDCSPLDADDLAIIEGLTHLPEAILNYPITVPPGGRGYCASPNAPAPTAGGGGAASNSQVAEVDCSGFALQGPFSNISPRPTTFSWTEAPGATEYEIVFHSVFTGQEAGSYRTPNTSITVVMGDVPTGSEFQWEVRAYRNGQYACVTARTAVINMIADPEGGGVDSSSGIFAAAWSCAALGGFPVADVTVNWVNAPAGTTTLVVNIFNDTTGASPTNNISNPPTNGSTVFAGQAANTSPPRDFHAGTVTANPSGTVINISPADLYC